MLCDNDELEVHASHKHGVHCKYFQCKKVFLLCTVSNCTLAHGFLLRSPCLPALWAFGCSGRTELLTLNKNFYLN